MSPVKNLHLMGAACALVLPLLACPKSATTPETTVSTIPVGDSRCANGGIEVTTGKSKQDICNESPELTETQLPIGNVHCPNGGVELQTGYAEGDGGVDVTSTQYVCTNDGTDVGSFVPPMGPAGAFSINDSGGNATTGSGGPAGVLLVGMPVGSNGGHVKLFATGSVSATVALPSPLPTPVLGSKPWTPTANAEVTLQTSITPSGLSPGAVFTDGDDNLYIWNGASADIATGVSIPAGVTVTFDIGTGDGAGIELTDDFVNAGTVTTALMTDGVSRGSLSIGAAAFQGLSGSSINLPGATGTGGGNGGAGGNLDIECGPSMAGGPATILNAGSINLAGGAGAVGGQGGANAFLAYSGVTNTGSITTTGGTSQSGAGAQGGTVELQVGIGPIENSGNIDTTGSDGNPTGGESGPVEMVIMEAGATVNTGNITTHGGNSSNACSSGCSGASGGPIEMISVGGNFTNSGNLLTYGGEGGAGSGGPGGPIILTAQPVSGSEFGSTAGTVEVSGNLDVHGGGGAAGGGSGATIQLLTSAAEHGPVGQEVILFGYGQGIALNGGNGTEGAPGGQVQLLNSVGTAGGVPVVGGSVINTCNISLTGGEGSTTSGGQGGVIQLVTQNSIFFQDQIEMVINSGTITATGGNGATAGGNGGSTEIETRNGFINTGNWTMNAGAATGSGGTGGDGEGLQGQVTQGPVSNTGNFSINGGNATASGGIGGNAGAMMVFGGNFTNSGNFSATGGNGAATGGNGGEIQLLSVTGSVQNTGTASVTGGTGATAGTNGAFFIGG